MRFRTEVEPPEPMRGLEVPDAVVKSLGAGARPRVDVTINGHTWNTRIAIMRGRHLIGLSNANRAAAGVAIGEMVEVQVELDTEPITVEEPEDFAAVLAADPDARAAYNRLTLPQRRQQIRFIDSAKKPETRLRRIRKIIDGLRAES
ncbi:YdeI/OmpD-associated family protein [Nocardia aobensis]|uniref:YdeI/OmpD-associated family protein n=1 Tax=Nocardia aobensis TaxID=257277 RepID=UPI00056AA8C9|nr:YdeI/OmpD-associated family protein [Nocardia aobensis]